MQTAVRFKIFKNRFSHSRIGGWPDVSAKVDLCVANRYILASEIIDFSYFPKF